MLDSETVSRHIFAPSMGESPREKDVVWKNVFQLQSAHQMMESLVWRRYAPDSGCVHSLGRIGASEAARSGQSHKSYTGFRSAALKDVREFRNVNGHGFRVFHAPEEGIHHAHITYQPAPEKPLTKNDKSELKRELQKLFSEVAVGPE